MSFFWAAASLAAAVEEVCYETVYDGVDDYYSSSDAALKIVGDATYAFSVLRDDPTATSSECLIGNLSADPGASVGGFAVYFAGTSGDIGLGGQGSNSSVGAGVTDSAWHDLLITVEATVMTAYLDGVLVGTHTVNAVTSTSDFLIGDSGPAWVSTLEGKIRDLEIYSGVPSNPTDWVAGDTDSLTGVTLVMQSKNGSGTDNEQGLTFTATGDPVTQVCAEYETVYDGVDDYAYTSDATMKISGAQTWCLEVNLIGHNRSSIISNFNIGSNRDGLDIGLNSSGAVSCSMGDGDGVQEVINGAIPTLGQWVRIVLVCNGTDVEQFQNGVSQGTSPSSTLADPTTNFYIAAKPWDVSEEFNGKIRNIELYSGAATNPADWVPADTDSLTGATLVFQSKDGSGNGNDQGVVFTVNGDPVTQVEAQYETVYDGVDDMYASSDAALKIVGDATYAFSVLRDDPTATSSECLIGNLSADPGASVGGFAVYFAGTSGDIGLGGQGSNSSVGAGVTDSAWHDLLITVEATVMTAYLDGVLVGTHTVNAVTSTSDFLIGDSGPGWVSTLEGKIRDLEVYSGVPSNPTDWVAGDTDSLTGTTLVMQSKNGSGLDNEQGLTFTATGDPVTQERPLNETLYDGVDDTYKSSDAALKVTGDQVWAAQITPVSYSGTVLVLSNGQTAGGDLGTRSGYDLRILSSKWQVSAKYVDGVAKTLTVDSGVTPSNGQTYDIVVRVSGLNFAVFIDGVKSEAAASAAFPAIGATSFYIGAADSDGDGSSDLHSNVKVQNLEMFSGTASDADCQNWIAGSGVIGSTTLLMQSSDGSGTDNEQGRTFVAEGAPTIQERT